MPMRSMSCAVDALKACANNAERQRRAARYVLLGRRPGLLGGLLRAIRLDLVEFLRLATASSASLFFFTFGTRGVRGGLLTAGTTA